MHRNMPAVLHCHPAEKQLVTMSNDKVPAVIGTCTDILLQHHATLPAAFLMRSGAPTILTALGSGVVKCC
jgi:hypothetical protein